MTIVSTADTAIDTSSALVAEFAGGTSSDVAMMIGIGLVKDSDAVFFQYLGDDQTPRALMLPTSGKPLTRLANVKLAGISIADEIGEFKSTKLNLFLESSAGKTVMLTSGLTTIWSQCVITALMQVFNEYALDQAFVLDSWKGNSKMRPCFAAVRLGGRKVSDNDMYEQLKDARADRNNELVLKIMRDAVEILSNAVSGGAVDDVVVSEVKTEQPDF